MKNFSVKQFKQALDATIEEQINAEMERLQDKYPEEYSLGHDRDFVDVGVGSVCVRDDEIWDEDRLYTDAKENVGEDFFNNIAECSIDTKSADLYNLIQKYIWSK